MVVGDSNGTPMEVRYQEETPLFARKILGLLRSTPNVIVDYGCGCGRISKEILKQNPGQQILGIEPSLEMRELAMENIEDGNFICVDINECKSYIFADVVVLVFVLQHVPAIEIRDTITRIYGYLKPGGLLFYCGSDVRMAIRYDCDDFVDDRFLGVNVREELAQQFEVVGPAFDKQDLLNNQTVRSIVEGGPVPHPAFVWRKRWVT